MTRGRGSQFNSSCILQFATTYLWRSSFQCLTHSIITWTKYIWIASSLVLYHWRQNILSTYCDQDVCNKSQQTRSLSSWNIYSFSFLGTSQRSGNAMRLCVAFLFHTNGAFVAGGFLHIKVVASLDAKIVALWMMIMWTSCTYCTRSPHDHHSQRKHAQHSVHYHSIGYLC